MTTQIHKRPISARNQWPGRIVHIQSDGVMAQITLDCNGQEVVSVITRESLERLALHEGGQAMAIVKATDVVMGQAD